MRRDTPSSVNKNRDIDTPDGNVLGIAVEDRY